MEKAENILESQGAFQEGTMIPPEDVETMLALHKKGWGTKRIARELGVARNTVKRYLRQKGWCPYIRPRRSNTLEGLEPWVRERFLTHGNAAVVHQELVSEQGRVISLRTVQRGVQAYRHELKASRRATVRFETPPGKQLQIDFGSATTVIGGEKVRIHLFVATLGYSRRNYVAAFLHEGWSEWREGLEGAFRYFNGIPEQVLIDNPRALVTRHNVQTREVVFSETFRAFARYWEFQPRACLPYRPRTKGKDERAVGYVKRNAIAGREFRSWEALQEHLTVWMREVADTRIHGTVKERPIDRFNANEKQALKPVDGCPPFSQGRELARVVHTDGCVEVDTNFYSVPWRFIGERLTIRVVDRVVYAFKNGQEVSKHPETSGRHQRSIHREHLEGIVKISQVRAQSEVREFERSLSVYQAVVGGGW
jgi:transposase